MKSFFGIRPLSLFFACLISGSLTELHAAHTAFLFNTDGAPIPAVLTNAIKARVGNDAVIVEIKPGQTPNINGVPVKDKGAVTMPRFDTASAPAGVARHFQIAGDFTLRFDQSIWGWGDPLLKLEILGYAAFEPGSFVNVSALGKLGGAGGGDGGTPTVFPYTSLIYNEFSVPNSKRGFGGTPTSLSTAGGRGSRRGLQSFNQLPPDIAESIHASSFTGGTGISGQGDSYLLPGGELSGKATGGARVVWSGPIAMGGFGGARGRHASELGPGNPNGEHGGNGEHGEDGAAALSGANGRLETLAGNALHLRGGSGGGAGASGGWGVGGGYGGYGGGGGTSGGVSQASGGDGGFPGKSGAGGQGGLGGAGGGGGGGIQLLVSGFFFNGAHWEAKGAGGFPGSAGTLGEAGVPGEEGQEGGFGFGTRAGNGGRGGDGGKGGDGGSGGNGVSGSGGNIQIAASSYLDNGSTYDTGGGPGAPAGLVQRHHFNPGTINAPFGNFAAEANPYRSYVIPLFVPFPPPPTLPVSYTPMSFRFTGGPASYGIVDQMETMVGNAIAKINPPADCDAMVFRLDGLELFTDYTDYDFLAYVNIRPGTTLANPKVAAISPADTAMIGAPFTDVYQPSLQPLLQNKGYMNDPVYNPAGSGATPVNPAYGQIWFTTIEKGKSFNVSAEWSPYAAPRVVRGTPVRGFVSPLGGQAPQNVLFLTDKGNPDLVVEQASHYSVSSDAIMLETPGHHTITNYVRLGSTPTYRYKVGSSLGKPHSRSSGSASCYYYRPDGSSVPGGALSYSNRSNTDPAVSVEVAVPTQGRALLSEPVLSTGFFSPNIDETERPSNVDLKGRLVGPTPFAPFLAPTETGPGLTAVVDAAGQTSFMIFAMSNRDALPFEWAIELYDKPKLTQLNILNAQIVGTGSAAFSLVNSLPTVLDLGTSQEFMVTFTPPALGKYQATLRLQTDAGADLGQPGEVFEIQLHGTTGDFQTWAYNNLPQGQRGAEDDADGNGISNILEYGLNGGGRGDLPKIVSGSPSSQAQFKLPQNLRPDVFWSLDGSADLGSWQRVATRNAGTGIWNTSAPLGLVAEGLIDGKRRVSLAMPANEPKYFVRLVGRHASNNYVNDFSSAARADLRGNAFLDEGVLRLSNNTVEGFGAAVLDEVATWPGQTGFNASFDLRMNQGISQAGNGMSFSVGDLGNGVWNATGPATAHNLTVVFDTYPLVNPPPNPVGMRIVVNGITVATSTFPAFTQGNPQAMEVTYTPATGVSVRCAGNLIFANVAVPGFALQAGDRFGFSAHHGANTHESCVDNVLIQPR